ncbi:MAG: Nif3-like dinuclear metal center hexameric protein [Subdoligranulum variabile]|nr:MAG: Nif3-like dinuclear metal center hexameric protein [Subdoligranulum variabile]
MPVTVQEILRELKAFAPTELACNWDNVGLLVDAGRPVSRVLTALDITADVVREAAAQSCELIVSHHPVIFDPLKRIAADDVPALLLQNGISAICMHTNLDAAPGGVNDTLADTLGMAREGRREFADGCGRIGTVPATTATELARFCAATLHSGVKYVDSPRPVTCLAEVSGAGGSYLQQAIDEGADCLVTGEAAHHIALLAKQKGVGLVVAGHWGTEQAVADVLAARLTAAFPGLTAVHAAADTDPYAYL